MEGELFRLGPIALYSYGCALAAAFLAGTAYVAHEAARRRLDVLALLDLVIRVIVIGVIAGRIGYCLPDIGYYLTHPWDFFNVPQGGLSYLPAFIVAVAYLYWHARRRHMPFWPLIDTFAPGLAIGLIIGFLGAVEVQPQEGAFWLGSLYWPPPTLLFFTVEFAGFWHLATSRRRLAPGRRFCQVVAIDAAARTLSSAWAWALYGEALPHALSVAAGAALFAVATGMSWLLARASEWHLPSLRRKRLPARARLLRAGVWLSVYMLSIVLLGRTTGGS